MILAGLVIGVALGSLPTADFLARRRGLDLREEGSGDPGANNALRLGGPALAAAVLALDLAKGAGAVLVGDGLGGDPAAGIGATAGNVYNPWFRGRGGKGLAISAGVAVLAPATSLLLAPKHLRDTLRSADRLSSPPAV